MMEGGGRGREREGERERMGRGDEESAEERLEIQKFCDFVELEENQILVVISA